MKTKTVIAAALASVFAITAAAPSFAAGDPVKRQKHIHRMINRADTNKDGRVSETEMANALAASFAVLDTNHDGVLSKTEIDNRKATYKAYRQQLRAERKAGQHVVSVIHIPKGVGKNFAKVDANSDGVISKIELAKIAGELFKRRDHNKDGYISVDDFKA